MQIVYFHLGISVWGCGEVLKFKVWEIEVVGWLQGS